MALIVGMSFRVFEGVFMKKIALVAALFTLSACSPSLEESEKAIMVAIENNEDAEKICQLAQDFKKLANDKGTAEQMMKASAHVSLACEL